MIQKKSTALPRFFHDSFRENMRILKPYFKRSIDLEREEKMKKIMILALAILLAAITAMPVSAAPMGWYCKKNKDHKQPPLDSDLRIIEKYNGYYLDKRQKDDATQKVIYLTFDAGYENGNVEKVLDVLKKENVPAAFFILDNLILKNTDLVKRMVAEGHTVGNHTLRHRDMTKVTTKEAFAAELKSLEDIFREKIGAEMPKYYRPPEGKFSEENLKFASELGYKTIFWSFAYADWDNHKQMSEEVALKKILDHTHNGEILLLHPTSATNAAILDDLIAALKAQGYRFGTLDELTA